MAEGKHTYTMDREKKKKKKQNSMRKTNFVMGEMFIGLVVLNKKRDK